MAKRVISAAFLDDITECPVCRDSFNDPRSLPCLHTFCFACISECKGDKLPGDQVDCPLCRKQFPIPAGGLQELPKNFFIGKLLAVKDAFSSTSGDRPCDWCVADSRIPVDRKNKAKQFCVDCDENLCEDCVDIHSKLRRCNSHRIHIIGENISFASTNLSPTRCDKHTNEDLKLFCMACQQALCLICFATKHNGHQSAEIDEVAEEFKKEMKGYISLLEGGVECLAGLISSFALNRQEIIRQSVEIEAEIFSRAEQLKSAVESNKQQLIIQLTQLKTERVKEIDNKVKEITQNKGLIESLINYTKQLSQRGSNGDIAREITPMNRRVAEMKQFFTGEKATTTGDALATFDPSGISLDTYRHPIGKLKRATGDICQQFKPPVAIKPTAIRDKTLCPTLRFTLSGNRYNIEAVTSFSNQLFVIRHKTEEVEVYDSSTFKLQRSIKLPNDVGDRREGLAVCPVNVCLYVAGWNTNEVYKVNLSAADDSTTTKWSVAGRPSGLSVNKLHNLLVACFLADKVQEYTSAGTLVREIEKIVRVRHAVELNDGTLVVSQGFTVNCVSVVSPDGNVLRRYSLASAAEGTGNTRMKGPCSLAADKNGFVLAADTDNNRILVLNPGLTDARPLPLTLDVPLKVPLGLWFEESRGRLYVGENGGERRVLVFDNVYDLHTLHVNSKLRSSVCRETTVF